MRYLMTFSYDGTNFYGYQKQPRKRTVQNEIEKKLTQINSNKKVLIHASGRTDRGVHAINQKAHFDMAEINVDKLKRSLNKMLDDDIYIKDIIEVASDFHARFDIKKKEYEYKINLGEYNPIFKNYVYQYNKELNIENIKKACKYLLGTKNFKAFTKCDEEKEDYVRTIYDIQVNLDNNILSIDFIGSGFLRYMIRNIVGTLIEIGENKREISDIEKIILSEDRTKAGKTANACGLYLKDVYY